MAKRFTDTNKYKKEFIRGLPGAYKILWDYLYHDCDHSGIWHKDFEIAQLYVGKDMPVTEEEALKLFNSGEERILVLDNGSKWLIKPFIDFQYGILNPENKVHKSVIQTLLSSGVNMGLASPLQGAKDKYKDKDIVKDMDKDIQNFSPEMASYVTKWNAIVLTSPIVKLSGARKDKLSARLQEKEFVDNYETILKKIAASDFLSGRDVRPADSPHRDWKATFDWVIHNNNNYVRILEGAYDQNKTKAKKETPMQESDRIRKERMAKADLARRKKEALEELQKEQNGQ